VSKSEFMSTELVRGKERPCPNETLGSDERVVAKEKVDHAVIKGYIFKYSKLPRRLILDSREN
jgi:hypothetical protein